MFVWSRHPTAQSRLPDRQDCHARLSPSQSSRAADRPCARRVAGSRSIGRGPTGFWTGLFARPVQCRGGGKRQRRRFPPPSAGPSKPAGPGAAYRIVSHGPAIHFCRGRIPALIAIFEPTRAAMALQRYTEVVWPNRRPELL